MTHSLIEIVALDLMHWSEDNMLLTSDTNFLSCADTCLLFESVEGSLRWL